MRNERELPQPTPILLQGSVVSQYALLRGVSATITLAGDVVDKQFAGAVPASVKLKGEA